ncbi:pyridoxamine 5'-phosphate oxidase family protein [Streptomyces sp. BPTC-684]|uniref:pyridoxamine 5'-phosphate oxidase family protein n=1 Tax=Streptomyces sp. BPTC-684 TaxID=3043734 RepID=UPI0024B1D27B|nr:pyridoxamine 5'-phosphate oxidase family protein [Streptomyces sp. BPTC-684]WHM36505.1 pyridoxamine 5'-phosphate oxidase family protein [Streptomyces sp. BPTC-684]
MPEGHRDTQSWPLSAEIEEFLAEPGQAILVTHRPNGTPHVVPVSFTWDSEARLARVLTGAQSKKARNLIAAPGSRVALCQRDNVSSWVTLEGTGTVYEDPERLADGARRYAERYGKDWLNPPGAAVIEIAVDLVMARNV